MTLIYGHRGSKGEAPENTLASFQRWFNAWSSRAMTFSAASIFVAVLLTIV